MAAGRLKFTTNADLAVGHARWSSSPSAPPNEDRSADLQYVLSAASSIGRRMRDYKL